MQRVLVMGSLGSGKSTFARRLSEITDIPFVSLDHRMQANDYLREIARKRTRASIH
jgi:adenylate kinase family enzyme